VKTTINLSEKDLSILAQIESERCFKTRTKALRWALRKAVAGTRTDLNQPEIAAAEEKEMEVMVRIPAAAAAGFRKRAQAAGLSPSDFLCYYAAKGKNPVSIPLDQVRIALNQVMQLLATASPDELDMVRTIVSDCQVIVFKATR
jgi:hypothetical protein